MKFKNALISVSDKTGLVEFVKPLFDQGLRVVSTGGTAETLRRAGIQVIDVSEQTGFPEMMDGRVKTLHPKIHMGLLARAGHKEDAEILKSYQVEPFDLIVVNLYPFEKALEQNKGEEDLIENIDIGGPSLIRAAAKSFERLCVVCDPRDYAQVAERGVGDRAFQKKLAAKAFAHVSSYDAMISHALNDGESLHHFSLGGEKVQALRYGENPHQGATWYKRRGALNGWHKAQILQGKELSYNNLLDLEASLALVAECAEPAAVAVKHNSPCGVAIGGSIEEAIEKCVKADPVSVFGGILAINRPVPPASAKYLNEVFLECVVAPDFPKDSQEIFAKKKNLRLLAWPEMLTRDLFPQIKTIQGGFLVQEPDRTREWSTEWKVLGDKPSASLQKDLSLAWKVAAHLKSNAIAIVGGGQSLGLGMGQVNRVDSVELAIERMRKFHPDFPTSSAVLASDAFFPFSDSIEKIHAAGIRWVIQPGGSVKDEEVFSRARELGVHLVITGQRHFRH